jgi:hypothetical protein
MTTKKHRRARGSGSVFKMGNVWWIAYKGADGTRQRESTESTKKGDALRLLEKRNGAREHNLPIVRKAEALTFTQAAQAVIDDFAANGKASIAVVRRRIHKHLLPYFGGMRMAAITTPHVLAYIAHRKKQGIVNRKGARLKDVSNAEINRELQLLKRCFSLAIDCHETENQNAERVRASKRVFRARAIRGRVEAPSD